MVTTRASAARTPVSSAQGDPVVPSNKTEAASKAIPKSNVKKSTNVISSQDKLIGTKGGHSNFANSQLSSSSPKSAPSTSTRKSSYSAAVKSSSNKNSSSTADGRRTQVSPLVSPGPAKKSANNIINNSDPSPNITSHNNTSSSYTIIGDVKREPSDPISNSLMDSTVITPQVARDHMLLNSQADNVSNTSSAQQNSNINATFAKTSLLQSPQSELTKPTPAAATSFKLITTPVNAASTVPNHHDNNPDAFSPDSYTSARTSDLLSNDPACTLLDRIDNMVNERTLHTRIFDLQDQNAKLLAIIEERTEFVELLNQAIKEKDKLLADHELAIAQIRSSLQATNSTTVSSSTTNLQNTVPITLQPNIISNNNGGRRTPPPTQTIRTSNSQDISGSGGCGPNNGTGSGGGDSGHNNGIGSGGVGINHNNGFTSGGGGGHNNGTSNGGGHGNGGGGGPGNSRTRPETPNSAADKSYYPLFQPIAFTNIPTCGNVKSSVMPSPHQCTAWVDQMQLLIDEFYTIYPETDFQDKKFHRILLNRNFILSSLFNPDVLRFCGGVSKTTSEYLKSLAAFWKSYGSSSSFSLAEVIIFLIT